MGEELKPCPFCGSTNVDAKGWASQNSNGPACDDCGASAGSTLADTPEANIAAWNTRPDSTAVQELVEALRPLAEKKLPARRTGNASHYVFLHSEIEAAKAVFARLDAKP
ncbi:MAG: Lar family restriction alleviation protein [Pseudomonadota bacterium]